MRPNGQIVRKHEFPYQINDIDVEINRRLLKDFTGERTNFVQVGPKKYFFPGKYKEHYDDLYNFPIRSDDVWIITFPRSGTTWTQEMVWLMVNDLDFETALNVPLTERSPFLEFSIFVHDEVKKEFLSENSYSIENIDTIEKIASNAWDVLNESNGRRVIKTHLPFSLLPPNLLNSGCKIIYVARNPKDVAVSFYYLNRLIRTQGYNGDFYKYWFYFQNNLQPWTPYWEHVKEGWENRKHENVLFTFYEDINDDLVGSMRRFANFLNKKFNDEQFTMLENHLKIENFRKNKSVNFDQLKKLGILIDGEQGFVRKGRNGSYEDTFNNELVKVANKWIEENLKGTDIVFPK